MNKLIIYLTFNGNCREAMKFYQRCLGGDLYFQTIAESPMAEKLPDHMKNYILQAVLQKDDVQLMASDMVADEGLKKGNAISICVNCNSKQELKTLYSRLSKGVWSSRPIEKTFWNSWFAELKDKYGNHWLLNFK
jgi:PhnB protein